LHLPEQPLAAFVGKDAGGTWTLQVSDTAPGDTGTLLGWGLQVCPTGTTGCMQYTSTDVPHDVPDLGTITSTLTLPSGPIGHLSVIGLHGTHTFDQDLVITLIGPDGTAVKLLDKNCGNAQNFDLSFDDSAPASSALNQNCNSSLINDGMAHLPEQPLAAFVGKDAGGTWTLQVSDTAAGDTGTLLGWGLQVCPPTAVTPTPQPCNDATGFGHTLGSSTANVFSATIVLPPGLMFAPPPDGSAPTGCTAHMGTCIILDNTASYSVTLQPNETGGYEVFYVVADNVPAGTQLCPTITEVLNGHENTFTSSNCVNACGQRTPTPTVHAGACHTGDVYAAVGNGQVKHFDRNGNPLQTLDTTTGSEVTAGMAFDAAGNLYVTDYSTSEISKFDPSGNLLAANFAPSVTFSTPESIVRDAANNLYVAQNFGDLLKLDVNGNLLDHFPIAGNPDNNHIGDWIDLDSDQCTIFYTNEGSAIKRYNVCTRTQLPDFATGLPAPCYALRILLPGEPLPGGGLLVACQSEIAGFNPDGSVGGTLTLPNEHDWFAVNLDPDNAEFWSGNLTTGQIYRFDMATASQQATFPSNPNTILGGLEICGEPQSGNGPTATAKPTDTPTPSPHATFTSPPTSTPFPTHTPLPTSTPPNPPTGTRFPTDTPTVTPSFTPTYSFTATPFFTATATTAPTATGTATPTHKPKFTYTATPSLPPTATPTPTQTGAVTSTATANATASRSPLGTATGTVSPSPKATASGTPSALGTATASPTGSRSASPTGGTVTPTPTGSQGPSPTAGTRTPTRASKFTYTATPTGLSTATPTGSRPSGSVTPTPTGSRPAGSVTPTGSASPGTPGAKGTFTPTPTGSRPPFGGTPNVCGGCVGDCNCNGRVTIDEILTMVNIALGNTDVSVCPAGDPNADARVTIDEILTAVNDALNMCPATVTPTPTGTQAVAGTPTATVHALSGTATPTPTPTATAVTGGSIPQRAAGASVELVQGLRAIPAVISAFTQLAGGSGSSAAALIVGAAAPTTKTCSGGGSRSLGCAQTVSGVPPRNYTLSFSPFCTLNTAGGGTLTLQASTPITAQSTETGILATCSFPPLALSTATITGLQITAKNSASMTTLNAMVDLMGSISVTPNLSSSCDVAGIDMMIGTGSITVQSTSVNLTETFSNIDIAVTVSQFSSDCVPVMYSMTLNGAATFSGASVGGTLAAVFTNFVLTDDSTSGNDSVTLNGKLNSTCLGTEITLDIAPAQAMDAALTVQAGAVCPSAGSLRATQMGITDRVTYTAAGGVQIDLGNNGGAPDESYGSCLDPTLYTCPAGS
ncbi:MAG: proprotein convertase P-domain-containing protein, partial [Candidatus Binatia bacterium]